MSEALELGRDAVRRHSWQEALDLLREADGAGKLGPDDLLLLADAAWWAGDPDMAVEVFERAYAEYVRQGEVAKAASIGALLAYLAARRMAMAVAGAWIARVERLLEGQPESVGSAWLKILYLVQALEQRDFETGLSLADEAIDLSRRVGSSGVHSLALSFKGYVLIETGRWKEGLALIDEATVMAMSDEPDLRAASDVYCVTIGVCSDLAEYRRAGEWTEEAERWMRANSIGAYQGVCQVHRAELQRLQGSWAEAEESARRACHDLERFRIMDGVGFAHSEIGEVRRRMGDLDGADEAFRRAFEFGADIHPGAALVMLDRGEVAKAASSITARLTQFGPFGGESQVSLGRARLLPAFVDISLAADDVDSARAAAAELEQTAQIYESTVWEAHARTARGAILLHEGSLDEALITLDRAWRMWLDVGFPFESARARTLLGRARSEAGDEAAAQMEFGAARSVFERLGAATDLRRVQGLMGEAEPAREAAPRRRTTKVFMFTDLVTSTDLIGVIGDAAWEELLGWHDRVLRSIFGENGGEEVRHTGDGFFVAFEDARAAVEAAVAIQRTLETHRREHGFAPWVRIGAHVAEATDQGGDYAGQGVHVAARVGALAGRAEILVSSDLLDAVGSMPHATSAVRTVQLKGVAEPIDVASIEWH